MKIIVDKGVLGKILGYQSSIINKKSTIPILSHGIMIAEDDHLHVVGTDLDISLSQSIQCKVVIPGQVTFPASILYEIIKHLESHDVEISQDQNKLKIKCGKSKFSLPSLNVNEFPVNPRTYINARETSSVMTLNAQTTSSVITLKRSDFIELINKTRFAMQMEENRRSLNCIFFQKNDKYFRAVATDSHRLAIAQMETNNDMESILISRKTVTELKKLLDNSDAESIDMSISRNQVLYHIDNSILAAKLVEGNFPDYERVIPYLNQQYSEVKIKDLIGTILRLISISDDKSKIIKMHFKTDKTIVLFSHDFNSSAEEIIECQDSNITRDIDIGFNAKYILDIMNVAESEHVRIKINQDMPMNAVMFEWEEQEKSMNIIMPIRI